MPDIYSTIVVDPPWAYPTPGPPGNGGRGTRAPNPAGEGPSACARYDCLPISTLATLNIQDVVAPDAHLYLWVTNGMLVHPEHPAYALPRAWGFRPITVVTWAKCKADGSPSRASGYYYRGASEHVVFCVRGSLPITGTPATWFGTRRTRHSVKPDEFYALVEQGSPGPYLDVFARRTRAGWSCWGDECADPTAPNLTFKEQP